MKKEVRRLRDKAINALVLSIEFFNRPSDRGRTEAVLILLHHSFEMLLKSAILQRQGKIRKPRQKQTISYSDCVRKCLTDGKIKFLTDEQALALQVINGQRNAAQHYIVDISEHLLYFHAQAGVTLFRDVHDDIFESSLLLELPERVLPVSTTAPKDLSTLFETEVAEIQQLLVEGTRRKMDAIAKARSLSVLEGAVAGDDEQPGDSELRKICDRIAEGKAWRDIFPGVASINIATGGEGSTLNLRLTKNEGTPVSLLQEDERTEAVVGIRRVNELDHYSLGATDLAKKLGLTVPRLGAIANHISLRKDGECYKEFKIGASTYKRYSCKAIEKVRLTLEAESIDDIWSAHQAKNKSNKKRAKSSGISIRT